MKNETKLTAADLAMYLGANCKTPVGSGVIAGISSDQNGDLVAVNMPGARQYMLPEDVRPILRPLSDMTGEEAEEFVPLAAGSQISFFQRTLSSCPSNWIKWLIEFENGDMDQLIMNETGDTWFESYFKHDAERRNWSNTVNQHKQTMWLIRHGFDVFDWISAGLAIDKTKIETP